MVIIPWSSLQLKTIGNDTKSIKSSCGNFWFQFSSVGWFYDPIYLKALWLCLRDLKTTKSHCKNCFWLCYGSFLKLNDFYQTLFWITYVHIGYSLDPKKKKSFVKMTQPNKMIHDWAGKYFCNIFLLSLGPKNIISKQTKS